MKRLLCIALLILFLMSCLTACNFTQRASGALAGAAEATPKVEEMMTALAENRASDAKALLYPQATANSATAIAQMSNYLAGRDASSIELANINFSASTGTSGKTRQEQVVYKATLSDGEVIYIEAVYLSDNTGVGFTSFRLTLGVV